MAESIDNKDKKPGNFADDLDSMLDLDDGVESRIGLIDDDDDAIDRLLIGDAFSEVTEDIGDEDFDSIDRVLAQTPEAGQLAIDDIDEFADDVFANLDINPKRELESTKEQPTLDLMASTSNDANIELDGLNIDTTLPLDDVAMSEIDEFSDEPTLQNSQNTDFLLADFNIASDDDEHKDVEDDSPSPYPVAERREATMVEKASSVAMQVEEFADDNTDFMSSMLNEDESIAEPEAAPPTIEPTPTAMNPTAAQPGVDHGTLLATLTSQVQALSKSHKQTQHDLHLKADSAALNGCLETLENLQTEQKKTRRNLDALLNQKPIAAYVANGVAALAMLIAIGLGIEAYITKSQLTQLIDVINQIQQQNGQVPSTDAAANELLHKQVEELAVAQTVVGNQVSELIKAQEIGPGSNKPMGDLAELNDRDMQMGSAIEALQSKVSTLEKTRGATTTPKELPKKPVIEENWAVNLIAFKQDWYAKRKAEEFATKGVPAKVTRTDSKGETWYRLSVDGFKSQYDAAAYAAKTKKTLNLDSVWVAKSKD